MPDDAASAQTGDLDVSAGAPARRPATAEEARAVASPLRLRLIREVYDGPLTNSELAARVGRDKASVLHHVRVLVEAGFLEALPPRRGPRGSRERPYRSTGKSWRLDISEAPEAGDIAQAMLGAFLEEVSAPGTAPAPSRLALRLTPAQRADLEAHLDALARRYADLPPAPDGEPLALFFTLYRRPTAPGPTDGAAG